MKIRVLSVLAIFACSPESAPEFPAQDVPNQVPDAYVQDTNTKDEGHEQVTDLPIMDQYVNDVIMDEGAADVCPLISCDKECEYGYLQDPAGCDICECRACKTAADCASTMICKNPECTKDGHCRCDCAASEGMATYYCPGGAELPWCSCSTLGIKCIDHPEYHCPELCKPSAIITWPCPSGAQVKWCSCKAPQCKPECRNVGTEGEAWYDSCSGVKLREGPCAGCGVACGAIGTKSEGWVSSCTGLISYAQCAPKLECIEAPESLCPGLDCTGESASFTCPNGAQVPFCYCQPACPPTCQAIGTQDEGWYDCQGKLLKATKCSGCFAVCSQIGSKSEGWYASCVGGGEPGLIGWAKCSQGTWSCDNAPWTKCTQAAPCTTLGYGFLDIDAQTHWCCPGLIPIELDFLENETCVFPEIPGKVCSLCGDGECMLPENPCNCPSDCQEEPARSGLGEPCNAGWHCDNWLECVYLHDAIEVGVCSTVCSPDSEASCPSPDQVCLPAPGFQAPGFCMKACENDSDCPIFTRCGGNPKAMVGGCFTWGPCDPMGNFGCGPSDPQCRVKNGFPYCGVAGALKEGEACDLTLDKCGPGLMCGLIDRCWPICMNDEECKAKMYDFCLKKGLDRPFGHCMIFE